GITPSDSRESQNQICKKNALHTPKPGKMDYFDKFNHPNRSKASRNLTGDCLYAVSDTNKNVAGSF
ncbi:MAG TPA: hypothetical protein VKP52_13360, partial [Pseudolabrys sp.]|nr:hypothetical protein [Pseudolabrys sp.]